MENLVEVKYAQTGESTKTNSLGMREMQQRAYAYREAQYILLKAPPASGKSRALMFIALDKLKNQGIKKVIVAVPEQSIASSFKETELKKFGFFADWIVDSRYNLCRGGSDNGKGKVKTFREFMEDPYSKILLCTHATLRFACDGLEYSKFNDTLLAIDEFHHVSADSENNRLGEIVHGLMAQSTAHILAMTGSYFRGDCIPVLLPEDEEKFSRITYNYYEQLNGYTYLKSLGIGYNFYQGKYLSAIAEVLDTNKKTLIHIPNVNSIESTGDKYKEVDDILKIIGETIKIDPDTGIIHVKRHSDGKILKVADIVDDDIERLKVIDYLRNIKKVDDIDIIIALGMAKEGFDWPFCEYALTIGYRASLTEVVQIIGRCTRDSENKSHAQFTNLIAQPDAQTQEVSVAVNNMLKAITCSLLMEQVLAPNFNFKRKVPNANEKVDPNTIRIQGFKEPSAKVKRIIESDLNEIKAKILQDENILRTLPSNEVDAEYINKTLIPKIIRETYPDLTDEEVEQARQWVVADSVIKTGEFEDDRRISIRFPNRLINIDELSINLIDSINPFQKAYAILSKTLDKKTFKAIQNSIILAKTKITDDDAKRLWPEVLKFRAETGRAPDFNSPDPKERTYAAVILYLKQQRRKLGV